MKHSRSAILNLNQLESRETPATLVSPTTLTYQDIDGGIGTVKFTKPILDAATVNNVFKFSTGAGAVNGNNTTPQQLQLINLTALVNPQAAKGTGITVTCLGGDGFANIGRINATGIDLGVVNVRGDLGDIDAGDGSAGNAMASFTVHSIGRFGFTTGATDAVSNIQGVTPKVNIKTDLQGVFLNFIDPNDSPMASVSVGGSLIGGAVTNGGRIQCPGNVGVLKIGGDLVGGAGLDSGNFQALGGVGTLTVGGSLIGGGGQNSGRLGVSGTAGSVRISGSLIGGAGTLSGTFQAGQVSKSAFVGGSLIGGDGQQSGVFDASSFVIAVRIVGSVIGGGGHSSGTLRSNNSSGAVSIGGDVVGGVADRSGQIRATSSGWVSLKIGGSIIGGTGFESGSIVAGGKSGLFHVVGDLRGGGGEDAGMILSTRLVTKVKVGGSVRSGTGLHSGSLRVGETNSISVTGSLVGTAANPVIILAAEQATAGPTGNVPLRKLSIGRNVEFAQILTGLFADTLGPKDGDAGIGAVTVGGDWIASSISAGIDDGADNKFGTNDDAVIGSGNNANEASKIGSITIGGIVRGTVGGTDHFGFVAESIGIVKVGGTILPTTSGSDDFFIGITGDFKVNEI